MPSIEIENINIHYTKSGSGLPFILLHGTFLDSSAYKELIEILSNYYEIYAIDMPMHGKSDKPKKYLTIPEFSDLLKKFVVKMNIQKPVICAHSGGSLVAIDYVLKNQIKELVLIEPAGLRLSKSLFTLMLNIMIIKPIFALFWSPIRAINLIRSGLYNIIRNAFNENYWNLINENLEKDYSEEMKKISCPTKLLWAKYDELIPYKNSSLFQRNIKNSKVISINGSHDWPVLKPKEIMKYINDSVSSSPTQK